MNLISGKEALIALANGEKVFAHVEKEKDLWEWIDAKYVCSGDFVSDIYKFCLKSHTFNLNGIEVPAPFKPEVGEIFYYTSDEHEAGYSHSTLWCEIKNDRWVGMWRTEEEIKQVVAALRKVFKEPQQ